MVTVASLVLVYVKCGETGHEAKGCPNTRCGRCLRLGHVNSDCPNEVVCSVCGKEGHVFRACPSSYVAMAKGEGQSNATSSVPPVTVDSEPAASPMECPPVSKSASTNPAPGDSVLSSDCEAALECSPVSPLVLTSPVPSKARRYPVPVPRLFPLKPNEKADTHSESQSVDLMVIRPKCATGTSWYDEIKEPSLKRSASSVESDEDDPLSRARLKRSESSSS